ncbi:MAG: PQQ-binding-like beta-propeller repeat protein [Pirellulales bacterium]|nr:PQQ-binding-like beta-propeller repeat protein [Pirellulales bacterium]
MVAAFALVLLAGCSAPPAEPQANSTTPTSATRTVDAATPLTTQVATDDAAPTATGGDITVDASPVEPNSATAESWPLFRGSPSATGVAVSSLPENLEVLWQVSTPDGSIESTAAIVDGVAYVGNLNGYLYALNLADGSEKWKYQTEPGFYASAAVRDGRVYIGDAEGRFYCLDAASGELKWGFSSKAEIDSSANFWRDRVIFGSQDATLYCLNAATGDKLWEYSIPDQIRCFPTIADDRAFIAGCDSKLHVVDLATGQGSAQLDIESPTGNAPAVFVKGDAPATLEDMIYFGTEGETFFGINWRKSEIVWRYRNPQRAFPYRSSAALTKELVIVGGRDKMIKALDPATGEPRWTFPTKSRVDSSPVVVGQRVFVGGADGRLYGLSLKTGEKVWEYEAGGGFNASPAVAAGRLVIGNEDGVVFCFGAK